MTDTGRTFIANQELLCVRSDGRETRLVARVGMPCRIDDDEYRCPVELLGLDEHYPDMVGTSSMQALCLATNLLATRLRQLLEGGARLVHVGEGEQGASVDDGALLTALFGR